MFMILLSGLLMGEASALAEDKSPFPAENRHGSENGFSISIVPFNHDESPNAELMARRAEWILAKKLQAGPFQIHPLPTPGSKETAIKWDSVQDGGLFGDATPVDYLVSGSLLKVRLDASTEWKGNRFLGMAGIPIAADLSGYLFDTVRKQEIQIKTSKITASVPRLRIFGFNRNPFPRMPRTIDAFIHDAIYRLSKDVIAEIKANRVEETGD